MNCKNCGNEMLDIMPFCPECGAKNDFQKNNTVYLTSSEKSKVPKHILICVISVMLLVSVGFICWGSGYNSGYDAAVFVHEVDSYLYSTTYDNNTHTFTIASTAPASTTAAKENTTVEDKPITTKKEQPKTETTKATFVPIKPKSFFKTSGSGDDVVAGLSTTEYSYLRVKCNTDRHFSVKAHYDDTYDLLVNTSDPYSGNTLLYPDRKYTLEINSEGSWEVEAFSLGTTDSDTFSGVGDYVTPIFLPSSTVYKIVSSSNGHFSVKAHYNNGDYDTYDLLVNTSDPYSGNVLFRNMGGYSFFEIDCEGEWSITPQI